MTKQFIPNKRYGIDFAQKRFDIEVSPDKWVVVHADHEKQAREIVEEAGYVIFTIEEYVHVGTSTLAH